METSKKTKVRVFHIASMARCGETMMLRTLSMHPLVRIAGQLFDSKEGEKRLNFFRDWQDKEIDLNHEILFGLDMPENGVILVKQGVWKHRWPFDGFILSRNPLSIYYSLSKYDSSIKKIKEYVAHSLGAYRYVLKLQGNYERFYRWTSDIEKPLADKLLSMNFLELFCTFYNLRMGDLLQNNLKIFKYEDIVNSPETQLREVCKALKIEFNEGILDSHKYFPMEIGHGKNDLSLPIESHTNHKAKRLPVSIRDRILALTYETWNSLGYKEENGVLVPR